MGNPPLVRTMERFPAPLLRKLFTAALFAFALLTLTACGGGGGGSTSPTSSGAFTLSTDSLAFKVRNGAGTQSQTVTVTLTGSGAAYLGAAYTGGQTKPGWIDVNITGSGSTYYLSVSVLPATVTPGKYSTTFQVGTSDSSGNILSHQDFTVTFEVDQGVTIVSSPIALNVAYGSTPPTQQYTINVAADSTQQWTAESDSAWLHVPSATQTGSGSITATVDVTGLALGTYTGTVRVVDAADSTDTSTLLFTVNITAAPLTVNATTSSFSFISGGTPTTQSFPVNVTTTPLQQWTISSNATWLSVPSSTQTGSGSITATVDVTGLAPGTYTGTVSVVDPADSKDTSTLTFTVSISPAPLTASATASSSSFIFGDTPPTQSFPVNVTTTPQQQWTVTSDAAWLQVPSGAQTGSGSFNEVVNTASLAPGTYTAHVQVAKSPASSDPAVPLTFTLTVTPASLTITESAFTFGGSDGRAALTALPVNFSLSTGRASYPYSVTLTTDSGGNWLSVDHSSGSVGSAGTSVNLSVNTALLHGGTYTGEIHVSATVNGTAFNQVAPVTLNLEANRIVVSASGVGLSKIASRSVLTRTVKVFSALGYTNTPWSATSDSSWLTVTSSGVTGGNLVLTADPTSAPLDTAQFANVTITSSDPTVENQQSIRVGLFVSNTAAVDADLGTGANALATSPVEPIIAIGSNSTSVGIYNVNSGALLRTLANVAATSAGLVFSEDGQSLFVYDSTNYRVKQVDAVTGTQIATFDATNSTPGGLTGSAILTMHPNGYPMLITSGSRTYDLATGKPYTSSTFYPFSGALALTRSPDQSLLASEGGLNYTIVRSALNGGTLVMQSGTAVTTAQGRAGEACISASGDRIYTASGYPYNFPATSLSTGQIIQTLPGTNYPNSMQCVWNGLVIGGVDGYYAQDDIFVYDGPSGTSLAQLSSNGLPNAYRDLVDRGLAVSADGTRLISAWGGSPTASPAGVHFTSLPAPPP